MELLPLQQWGLFLQGLVLAILGVAFWGAGIVAFELIRRRVMEEEDE